MIPATQHIESLKYEGNMFQTKSEDRMESKNSLYKM